MSPQDRELLELAAKAAGYARTQIMPYEHFGVWREWCGPDGTVAGEELAPWNPLTDDGDALRLAVKLRISVGFDDFSYVCVGSSSYADTSTANVRRAIVEAAAEIGRTK